MNIQDIPLIKHTDSGNFFLLAGPCAIEGEEMAMRIAEKLVGITDNLQIPFVFKGSFKKANRSRIDSFSGIGDEKALKILRKVSILERFAFLKDPLKTKGICKLSVMPTNFSAISSSCIPTLKADERF